MHMYYQIVPDDNSCLFSSVALVFEQGISKAPQLRKGAVCCLIRRPYGMLILQVSRGRSH